MLFRSEAWASLSRLGAGQYALSLVTDPESSQATTLVNIIGTWRFTHPEIQPTRPLISYDITLNPSVDGLFSTEDPDLNLGFFVFTNFILLFVLRTSYIVLCLGPRRVDCGFLKIAWLTNNNQVKVFYFSRGIFFLGRRMVWLGRSCVNSGEVR